MRKYYWLLLFILAAIACRWGSFFISVINHDESTYIVIANEILNGKIYLRDLIDTKPIGIFWIYAALIKLTEGSIFGLRLAAAVVVGVGGWGLYLACLRALQSERAGVAAGVIYVISCSIFTYYGISPNTEIFFNLFTIAAVALAVAPRLPAAASDPFWHWPVAGLLLGLAVIIKPFAAAEALAVGLFMVWFYGRTKAYGKVIGAGLLLVGAFTLPLLFVFNYFRQLGLTDELYFYTFDVSSAYPIELPWYLRLKYMGDYLLRYAPFVILGASALVQCWRQKSREKVNWGLYLCLQFVLVTIVVLLTGKRFGHYQIQLHPVIALWAALWWAPGVTIFDRLRTDKLRKLVPYLLVGLALFLGLSRYFKYAKKSDEPTAIAQYFQDRLAPGETFFLINGWQISYHLLDRRVPTPYVHSSLLFLAHHVKAFQIDELAEAERILADDTVKYLVKRRVDANAETPFTDRVLEQFTQVDTIGEELLVYRRK
ncbi:MAG: glycosyltransferase family 39 protein [Bacteroidota bacterium]